MMRSWIGYKFRSSTGKTKEFKAFVRNYRQAIIDSLPPGAELAEFSAGHFYCSGFIKYNNGKFAYFSCPDVRSRNDDWYKHILLRTAKGLKDYSGGANTFTDLPSFKENVRKMGEIENGNISALWS